MIIKKLFFVILASAALFTVSSCEESYPEDLTTKQVFTFEVRSSDWKLNYDNDGLNPYYSCHFKVNVSHHASFDNSAALAYISFDRTDQPLPYIRHYENELGQTWTRTVDFDYSLDEVNFYVTNSDFADDRPETMYFRVMYIW